MIIDTNGFEIGDEVWVVWIIFDDKINYITKKYIVDSFYKTRNNVLIVSTNGHFIEMDSAIYHTEQECQLACDKLNGVNHD